MEKENPEHRVKAVTQVADMNERHTHELSQDCDPELCFNACNADMQSVWYVDSGATSHMCGNRDFFTRLDERHTGQIVLADGQKLSSFGVGEGILQCVTDSGETTRVKLLDVLYVPQLKGNLISVKKMTNKGLEVHFTRDGCTIAQNCQIVACTSEVKGLYTLNTPESALVAVGGGDAQCIHVCTTD